MSRIDACTNTLKAIYNFIIGSPTPAPFSAELLIPLISQSVSNFLFPDSTVAVIFDLLDICLSAGPDFSLTLDGDLINRLGVCVLNRSIQIDAVAKLLSMGSVIQNDAREMELLFGAALKRGAFDCAAEAALHLSGIDGWITENGLIGLIASEVISHISAQSLRVLALVCANPENAMALNEARLLEVFFSPNLPSMESESDELWASIFQLFAILPSGMQLKTDFVAARMQYISCILMDADFTKSFVNAMTVTTLISGIPFDELQPGAQSALIELMDHQLKSSISYLREHLTEQLNGSLGDPKSCSRSLAAMVVLHDCLFFFNALYDFPHGNVPIRPMDTQAAYPEIATSEAVIQMLTKHSSWNQPKTDLMIETFEFALRIYAGKAISMFNTKQMTQEWLDARKQLRDGMNKVIACCEEAVQKAQDLSDSYKFIEEMMGYLKDIPLKNEI